MALVRPEERLRAAKARLGRAMAGALFVLAFVVAAGATATAAERAVPASKAQIQLSFAPLVKEDAPAVVNIYARRVVESRVSPFLNDPFFRQFFGNGLFRGVPRQRIENSLGSGVIVRPDGLIVTNNHVIEGARDITVVLSDRREFPARIVLTDERTDLTLLRIDTKGEKLPYLKLRDSDTLQVGDLVLAIGNPFGVGQTVTMGIVSALARTAAGVSDYSFFIQTDAAINPGNSGGALIGMDGRLVGINTAIYSSSGGSVGIGFAIPANMVGSLIADELHGGKIVRPWLGASGETVTADMTSSLGLNRPQGVVITRLYRGGPADRAGLHVGDVLIAIDDKPVNDIQAVRFRIATLQVGKEATLTVLRGNRTVTIRLALLPAPAKPAPDTTQISGRNPLAGVTVANLSPALAEKLQVDSLQTGVIVTQVAGGSPAERVGLRTGDFVTKLNGKAIHRVTDLKNALDTDTREWQVTVRRGGRLLSVTIGG